MSNGKRNVAFGNDEDFEIEYVSKSATQDKTPREERTPREVVIDSVDVRGSTREELIKNELNDFAKQSPESIAAIIKGMFRGE